MADVDSQRWITLALLLMALILDVAWPPTDFAQQTTLRLLGAEGQRLELEGGPAFRVGARWLLFFDRQGKAGPIRGAIAIEDDQIRELHLFDVREGIDRNAFSDGSIAHALIDQAAKAPVEVEVVSGATISSQRLIDSINVTLEQWRSAAR